MLMRSKLAHFMIIFALIRRLRCCKYIFPVYFILILLPRISELKLSIHKRTHTSQLQHKHEPVNFYLNFCTRLILEMSSVIAHVKTAFAVTQTLYRK